MGPRIIAVGCLLLAVGCNSSSSGGPRITSLADLPTLPEPPSRDNRPRVIPHPDAPGPAADAKRIQHEPSGTSFILPPGWEVLPTQTLAGITRSLLRKKEADGKSELTLVWTPVDLPDKEAKLAEREVIALREVYGDKVADTPEAILVGRQMGYAVPVSGGPGNANTTHGASYVFFVKAPNGVLWQVKYLATVPKSTPLDSAEELLHNFRWN